MFRLLLSAPRALVRAAGRGSACPPWALTPGASAALLADQAIHSSNAYSFQPRAGFPTAFNAACRLASKVAASKTQPRPRRTTGYQLFVKDMFAALKAEFSAVRQPAAAMKDIGNRWSTLDVVQKKVYNDRALEEPKTKAYFAFKEGRDQAAKDKAEAKADLCRIGGNKKEAARQQAAETAAAVPAESAVPVAAPAPVLRAVETASGLEPGPGWGHGSAQPVAAGAKVRGNTQRAEAAAFGAAEEKVGHGTQRAEAAAAVGAAEAVPQIEQGVAAVPASAVMQRDESAAFAAAEAVPAAEPGAPVKQQDEAGSASSGSWAAVGWRVSGLGQAASWGGGA